MRLSYCTNVHAGTSLASCMNNLETYAVKVKAQLKISEPLGVGLWLSADAVGEALKEKKAEQLRTFLDTHGLFVHTMNGFPFGHFHAPKVKHAVYLPAWTEDARLRYTLDLATLLAQLLPEGEQGSISTLPLGWGKELDAKLCAKNLRVLAQALADLHAQTGKHIRVALEPEPGCAFDTAVGAAAFFNTYLNDAPSRAYLGICHDVCHSAVMFEPQAFALQTYREAGIALVKIQLSSAIEADFAARHELAAFAEDRYLHQTMVQSATGEKTFFEDLPFALASEPKGTWRVHFHVPLFVKQFGLLKTTQSEMKDCLSALLPSEKPHLEIETYAWNVLPKQLQEEDLATGIAKEMLFAQSILSAPADVANPF